LLFELSFIAKIYFVEVTVIFYLTIMFFLNFNFEFYLKMFDIDLAFMLKDYCDEFDFDEYYQRN